MLSRPWPIVIIAIFHILAPLANFVMSAQMMGLSLEGYAEFLNYLKPFEIFFWFLLPIMAGIALLSFRWWSYYAFIVFMIVVFLEVIRQKWQFPNKISWNSFAIIELINLLIILYFISPSARKVYMDQRIRWWQQKPRYSIEFPVKIVTPSETLNTIAINISEGGLYLDKIKIPANTDLKLHFELANQNLNLDAIAVHTHGAGVGVMFKAGLQGQIIKSVLKLLKKQGVPIRGRELTGWKSFQAWAQRFITTGKGFFPETEKDKLKN